MKKLYILFLITLLPLIVFSRHDERSSTDSTTTTVTKHKDSGLLKNLEFIRIKEGDRYFHYIPYHGSAYGTRDGRVFISKEREESGAKRIIVLELLHQGNPSLYYYNINGIKTYFIEKDSTMFGELPKKNYPQILSEITDDCPVFSKAIRHVDFKKESLTSFIKAYNNGEPFSLMHLKYGLWVGQKFLRLNPSDKNTRFSYTFNNDFSVALFFDLPVSAMGFSFHPEVIVSRQGFSFDSLEDDIYFDFIGNFTSVQVPLLLRYSHSFGRLAPYANLGLSANYFIKKDIRLFETSESTNNIFETFELDESMTIKDFQTGYTLGAGLEYRIDIGYSVFAEIRYSGHYGRKYDDFTGSSSYSIVTGISF